MIECFLLDMDGVIANFVAESLKVCNMPIKHDDVNRWDYFTDFMTYDEFWDKIDADTEFWGRLKPYPWAYDIVGYCRSIAPTFFCSSPATHHDCASAKILWLRENGFMDKNANDYVLTSHKWLMAGSRRVLIDDSDHQIKMFRKSGGIGVTFPQRWNEAEHAVAADMRIDVVKSQISKIKNLGKNAGKII